MTSFPELSGPVGNGHEAPTVSFSARKAPGTRVTRRALSIPIISIGDAKTRAESPFPVDPTPAQPAVFGT